MRLRALFLFAWLAGCSFPTGEFHLGTPTSDRPDVSPPRDAADVIDVQSPDVTDVVDAGPDTEAAVDDVADVTETGADVMDVSDTPDVADDTADVADVTDVSDAPDAPEADTCPAGQTRCGADCIDTNTSGDNCGRCGNRCSAANATSTCVAGACTFACNSGFADCDMMASNGCEADLNAPSTCGSCSARCTGANGTPTCAMGACGIMCNAGFGNCDGNAANGCETNTNTSTTHCGMCGRGCSNSNGTPDCVAGACTITCLAGFGDCDTMVANGCETITNTDANNCGRCGVRCAAGQSCVRGVCTTVCPDTMCGTACVDLMTNVSNCGMCGRVCTTANGTPRCVGSTCGIATCNTGYANCDSNAANGCETNLQTDVGNCGACGNTCNFPNATAVCMGGTCALGTCNRGFGNCDGNAANGCETNLLGDIANCGTCSNRCNPANGTARCTTGACGIAACNTGFADCNSLPADGCEVNTLTDTLNCGACGRACVAHPGSYSNACGGGTCMPTCTANYANCDGNVFNGCETNLSTNPSCGACFRTCTGLCGGVPGVCAAGTPGTYARSTLTRTYIDACAQTGATRVLMGVDDANAPFTLPFAFRYWTTTYSAGTMFSVSSNGWVNMTGGTAAPPATNLNALIPDINGPNGVVAVYLLDLITSASGVCIATIGAVGARSTIVQWVGAQFYGTRMGNLNFEVIFNEGTNSIDMLYQTVEAAPPRYQAAVGVENQAGNAAVVVCSGANQACTIANGTAFRFQ